MATPTYADLKNLVFDRCQINVATDAPVDDTTFARGINHHLRDVWEMSGGRIKIVPSATAWSGANLCTGRVAGILTDVEDIKHLYATATAPFTVSCTTAATTALVAASGSFITAGVLAGMAVSGTNIAANTFVAYVTDATNLVLTKAGTGVAGNPNTITFSPVVGDELDRVEPAQIMSRRASSAGMPTYLKPKEYAIQRRAAGAGTDATSVTGLLYLEYWPPLAGFYFPCELTTQYVPIDSATVTTPDLDDTLATDGGLLYAAALCGPLGRPDLLDGILRDISQRTQLALERRRLAMADASADA